MMLVDDSNIFASFENIHSLQSEINKDLNYITIWLKVDLLSLNITKTHFVIFTKKKKINNVALNFGGCKITEVDEMNFLIVSADNKLTRKKHINHIVGKLPRDIGLVAKVHKPLKSDVLIYGNWFQNVCGCQTKSSHWTYVCETGINETTYHVPDVCIFASLSYWKDSLSVCWLFKKRYKMFIVMQQEAVLGCIPWQLKLTLAKCLKVAYCFMLLHLISIIMQICSLSLNKSMT